MGELPVEHHGGKVGAQRLSDLAPHTFDVVDQVLQRAVFDDPLGGGLLPHPGDARQVVAGVAAQRREVRVLLRCEPVLLDHRFGGESGQHADALDRVEHGDVVVHELQRVAVTSDDQDPVPGLVGLGREGGDDVVGLEPRLGEDGDTQCVENFLGDVDLAAELIRGGATGGLVLGEPLGAEGLP